MSINLHSDKGLNILARHWALLTHHVLDCALNKESHVLCDNEPASLSRRTLRPRRSLDDLDLRPLLLEDNVATLDKDGQEVNPDVDNRDRSDNLQCPPDDVHLCFLSTRFRRG